MKSILVTGSNGAIGQEICKHYADNGWWVIGSDISKGSRGSTNIYISIDLNRLCIDEAYRNLTIGHIVNECEGGLDVLINNAAVQIISSVKELSFSNWQKTINVNLNSVFLLIKGLLQKLEKKKGCVINVASIHATLTKSNFSAYSTSKAGLVGLTKSLAVELGTNVRINAICPAAIATPMLFEGFVNTTNGLEKLIECHPTSSIGNVKDVLYAVLFLADSNNAFLNGTILQLDGGISSKLHDPG